MQYANHIDGLSRAQDREMPKAEQECAEAMQRILQMNTKSFTATIIALMGYEGGRAHPNGVRAKTERRGFASKQRVGHMPDTPGAGLPVG